MPRLNILVVGASIAGPTTAYWLAKAGANVTVIERFPSLRTGGQNVDIRHIGVQVMRKMDDMESQVRANLAPLDAMVLVDEKGRPYGSIGGSGNPDQQALLSEYEIFRGDLSRILYDLTITSNRVKYIFGEQIKTLNQDDSGVHVEFSSGRSDSFDLVVACDGATSRTRKLGMGEYIENHTAKMNVFAAYFSTKKDYLHGTTDGVGYSKAPGKTVYLGQDRAIDGNRATLMRIFAASDEDAAQELQTAIKGGEAGTKAYVEEMLGGMEWICKELKEELLESKDFYATEWIQVKPPSLYNDRFVLVGDAGYGGAPGAGTSLAMAGGYVLAGELCKHAGDIPAALAGYQEVMTPWTKDMQIIPTGVFNFMAPQTQWGLTLRNTVFAFVSWSGLANLIQRLSGLFGGAFASSERYVVPEYEIDESKLS